MAGLIPQSFIDELLLRTDIVEVIEERIPLKQSGRDLIGRCPFHEEKTPSFSVSRTKQFYYCFGCHASGNALGFMMNYEGLNFVEAIEELAEQANLNVPRDEVAQNQGTSPYERHSALFELLDHAKQFYQSQLRQHPEAERAIAYLKERGVSGQIATRYELGFAPAGWSNLIDALSGQYPNEEMKRAGLITISQNNGREYDRFRDRIIFPIHNRRGQVTGFGARALTADDSPKYLNSPETPIFHKGKELYGLFQARGTQRRPSSLLVVEGYLDVIALAQFGYDNAVGTLGTAVTVAHITSLFRMTPQVIFCFDGDNAGQRAAWRALETVLPELREGRSVGFLFLPDGDDPDSFVRTHGTKAFDELIATAAPVSEFLFSCLREKVAMETVEGRARLVELALPLIQKIPPGVYKVLLERELFSLAQLDDKGIVSGESLKKAVPRLRKRTRPLPQRGSTQLEIPSLIKKGIRLLLHHPKLACRVPRPDLDELERPGIGLFCELFELCREHPHLTTGGILEYFREHQSRGHLAKLASDDQPVVMTGAMAGSEDDFAAILENLAIERMEQRYSHLAGKTKTVPLTDEEKTEFQDLYAALSSSRASV